MSNLCSPEATREMASVHELLCARRSSSTAAWQRLRASIVRPTFHVRSEQPRALHRSNKCLVIEFNRLNDPDAQDSIFTSALIEPDSKWELITFG